MKSLHYIATIVKAYREFIDGYLANKDVDYVNKKAMEGTVQAHVLGGVPNIIINIQKLI